MKKILILISFLSLASCTPPMKSEPNKCKCTPGHCCADTLKINLSSPQEPSIEENPILDEEYPSHNYEEIPSTNDEIL